MRKKIIILIVFIIFIFQLSSYAESRSSIFGKVVDAETKAPVKNATIIINVMDERGGKISTQSNEKGEFEFKEFPADDYEYVIDVCNPLNFVDPIFYKQRIRFGFKLQKGKNLYLRPIELKRGIRIEGNVKLWDGSIINKARIRFKLKNKDSLDSIRSFWQGTSIDENGHYISPLIPGNVELIMEADLLQNLDRSIAYGKVKKAVTITDGEANGNIDIIIPNIKTEIKGRVTNKNGIPLPNQRVGISYSSGVSVKTDDNGSFSIKHILPGKIMLYIRYKIKTVKWYDLKEFSIYEGDSLFIDIIVDDDNYFKYTITKKIYQN